MAKKKVQPVRKAVKAVDNKAIKAEQIFFKEPTKTGDVKTELAKTIDGFENFTARLGVQNQNQNTLSDGFYSFNLLTRNRVQLEAAYRGSWLARKIIDCPAEDMTRAGIDIVTNDEADRVRDIQADLTRLKIWTSMQAGIRWGNLYGGALGILQIKGQNLSTPLDPEKIGEGQFQGLAIYDRWQLNPDLTEVIDSGPDIGLPKYYYIVTTSTASSYSPAMTGAQSATGQIKVHYSRCIRFGGKPLPFWQAITEMMWDESVLEVLWDRLIAFDTATMSTANLISRAQLRTVGVDGLREILAAGGPAEQALLTMFEYMRMLQTNEGITLIDKEDTFASTAYTFAGLSDVLTQFAQQNSGAADIPLIRLFSQSPTGMNATGDSDLRQYYDAINARQNAQLRNGVWLIIQVLWRSTYGEAPPEDLEFTFVSLWQMTPLDQATLAKSNTETIIGAFDAGLLKKETAVKELRQSSGDHGLFTNVTDEEVADAREEDENPPEPLPLDPSAENAPGSKPSSEEGGQTNTVETPKMQKAGDSARKKIRAWINQ